MLVVSEPAPHFKAHFHHHYAFKKHGATRLHYDLRLAWNGVLKSWALPMGPSCRPGEEREAIQVPDHNRTHIGFEGLIPKPRYGAGIVMLWDCGVWAPQPEYLDVDAALRNGYLGLTLVGRKLKGNWSLVRRDGGGQKKLVWLFAKDPDSFARSGQDADILEEAPNSALTGKSLEEIEWAWNNSKAKGTVGPALF